MKIVALLCAALALAFVAVPTACADNQTGGTSPIAKVIELLGNLHTKIASEGVDAQKAFEEFSAWCQDRSKNLEFEIKTAKAQVATLTATIEQHTSLIGSFGTKVEELSSGIAADEADLKAATNIRGIEGADFAAEDKALSEAVDVLMRAVAILEREMKKSGGSASMVELKAAGNIVKALSTLVQASVIDDASAAKLTALVQSSHKSEEGDNDASFGLGAPEADAYEGHSGDIIQTLGDLLEKAQDLLNESRKKETTNKHNFELLKQSLEDEIKFANKDMADAKKALAESGQKKASAEGDLVVTSKDLSEDGTSLDDIKQLCQTKAQDHESAIKSRTEELAALAAAQKVLSDETGSAATAVYSLGQISFLQIDSLKSDADLANFEAVRFVRDLARKHKDTALAQLAMRMAAAMQHSSESGEDPFAKVKGLIFDMIKRLHDEANADALHKDYCDKELGETKQKQAEKTAEIEKLSTQIDAMSSRSAELKEEVADLHKALAELAAAQAEMTSMRQAENKAFVNNKADTEQGLQGVKTALKILREYYAQAKDDAGHGAAVGAGTNIVGLLEVVEGDFTKSLAEFITIEDNSEAFYKKQTTEMAIEKTMKDQDVKYKVKESADLDKAVSEATSDRAGVQTEVNAVNEYWGTLLKQCSDASDTYDSRKVRREAEIAGLKEALSILSGEAAMLQKAQKKFPRNLRVQQGQVRHHTF